MVSASSQNSQPAPAERSGKAAPCPPDCDLPENSQRNLDARLDEAIEETFPTSDPVAVMVTRKAGPEDGLGAASSASGRQRDAGSDEAEQETAEELLDQVKRALEHGAQAAYGTFRDSYDGARHYARQTARAYYPEAERSYRAGRRTVEEWVIENPWLSLLTAGAIGYGLAWMIHREPHGRDTRVADHARTRTRYVPRRDD